MLSLITNLVITPSLFVHRRILLVPTAVYLHSAALVQVKMPFHEFLKMVIITLKKLLMGTTTKKTTLATLLPIHSESKKF